MDDVKKALQDQQAEIDKQKILLADWYMQRDSLTQQIEQGRAHLFALLSRADSLQAVLTLQPGKDA